MTGTTTERLVANISGDIAEDLRKLAARHERSLAGEIRHVLRLHVESSKAIPPAGEHAGPDGAQPLLDLVRSHSRESWHVDEIAVLPGLPPWTPEELRAVITSLVADGQLVDDAGCIRLPR